MSLDDLLDDVNAVHVPGRTKMDEYRDFRELFLGSDLGKRVLRDIMAFGRNWRSVIAPGDVYETHCREGERRLMLRILHTIETEPAEPPTTQQTRQEN